MRLKFAMMAVLGASLFAADPPTIAVMQISGAFSNESCYHTSPGYEGNPNSINGRITDRVTMALVKSKRFTVLERNQLGKVLDEGAFSIGGLADESKSIKMGKQLGAHFTVLGSFTGSMLKVGKEMPPPGQWFPAGYVRRDPINCNASLVLSLRVVNAETGVISGAVEVESDSEGRHVAQSIEALLDGLTKKLDDAVPDLLAATGQPKE